MNEETKNDILSPMQMEVLNSDKINPVSDATFKRILAETGGKSAIVIVLPVPIASGVDGSSLRKFHVDAVNVGGDFMPVLLLDIVDGLIGRRGKVIKKTESRAE